MKKFLAIGLAFTLLTRTTHIECSASAKALRYLQAAGAAAWQGTKKTTLWAIKNPYKIAGGMIGAITYADFYINQNFYKEYYIPEWQANTLSNTEDNAPIIKMVKETCREHGINNVFIVLKDTYEPDLMSFRNENKMFIFITQGAKQKMLLDLAGKDTDIKMKHWKALMVHEIKHLLANDSTNSFIEGVTLQSELFKREVITALTVGTAIHAITNALSKLPASPKARTAVTGYLVIQSLIAGKTVTLLEKKHTIFSSAGKEWAKSYERRADNYIKETAFKTKNPHLLDDFAEWAEAHIKAKSKQSSRHPLMAERAHDARAAAAELREEIRTGRPTGIVANHHCSPF
jgi:hypothetical protein